MTYLCPRKAFAGWKKQGNGEVEPSQLPVAYQSSNSLHKLSAMSAGNSFDSLPTTLAEEEVLASSRLNGGNGGGHRKHK